MSYEGNDNFRYSKPAAPLLQTLDALSWNFRPFNLVVLLPASNDYESMKPTKNSVVHPVPPRQIEKIFKHPTPTVRGGVGGTSKNLNI